MLCLFVFNTFQKLYLKYLDLGEFIKSINIIPRQFLKRIGQRFDNTLYIETFHGRNKKKKKELKQDLVTPRKRKRNHRKKNKTKYSFIS